jgi:hypothetical protein
MNLQRHFSLKHPLFRKTKTPTGVEWRKSIYYLWWEFLRRHDGYKATCENDGKGRYAKLYEDFGDVHTLGFREWWTKGDRGARLFAEPAAPQTVQRLTKDDVASLGPDWDDEFVLVIAAPISLPKRYIQNRIAKLLKSHHPGKPGKRTLKESRALYPVANQFNIHSLQIALAVYDLKKANPKMKLWEIAQQLRFTSTLNANEIGQTGQMASTAIGKKNTMGVAVRRKLDIAESVIDGVGKGIFPQYVY